MKVVNTRVSNTNAVTGTDRVAVGAQPDNTPATGGNSTSGGGGAGPPIGPAGGDLAGTYPNPVLAPIGGGAIGPIGDSTHVPRVTRDAKGRITALTSVAIAFPASLSPPTTGPLYSRLRKNITGTITATGDMVWAGPDIFNVKDYGALGDGSTNDSTAINAAIAAINAAGKGTLLFPDGVYLMNSAPTTITVPVSVVGYGMGTSKLRFAAGVNGLNITLAADGMSVVTGLWLSSANASTGNTALYFRNPGTQSLANCFVYEKLYIEGAWSVGINIDNTAQNKTQGSSIRDINFNAPSGTGSRFDYGIKLAGASNVAISSVRIFESNVGIAISGSPLCEGITITDSAIVNCYRGVESSGSNVWITSTHVQVGSTYTGSSAGANWYIRGGQNYLQNCYALTDKDTTTVVDIAASDTQIRGLMCLRTSGQYANGIVVTGSSTAIIIQDCYLRNITGNAVSLGASTSNCLVTDNAYFDVSGTYPFSDAGTTNRLQNNFDIVTGGIAPNGAAQAPIGFSVTAVFNPANLVPFAQDFADIAFPGAVFGQGFVVAPPYDLQNMMANVIVTSSGTVRINVFNSNAGVTVNLGSGTWTVTRVS